MCDPVLTSNRRLYHVFVLASAVAAVCGAACRSAPASVPADTWATVDGRTITQGDVEKAYRGARNTTQSLSDDEAMTEKLTVLNDLILQDILLEKARALKLDVAQSEVDTAFNDAKKNVAADAFEQELTRRGLTPDDLRDGLRRELLTQKVVTQAVVAKTTPTEREITDAFNTNRAQFNVPEESYRIAQIVVTPVRDQQITNTTGDDATTPQEATAKYQMLMERLKAGGSFAELATSYSEDPESAPHGGDLGLVAVSQLKKALPALRDAVLNKASGSMNVVSAGGGYNLVLVISHEAAGQRDLSMPDVRKRITDTLQGRKDHLLRAAYLSSVREDAAVVNYAARRLIEAKDTTPKDTTPKDAAPKDKTPATQEKTK